MSYGTGQDHMIDRAGIADPAEQWVRDAERAEEAYIEAMRGPVTDAIQCLTEGMGDADHADSSQESSATRLLLLGVLATLGEI